MFLSCFLSLELRLQILTQSQQRELIGNGDDEDKYEEIEIKTDQIESGNEYVPGDQKTPQLH